VSADFTPSRLAFARSRTGLARARLAERVGISPRMLAYYEEGSHQPNAEVMQRLADELSVPASFFAAPEIAEIPVDAASFRALTKMSAGRRDAALAGGALAIEFNRWLEARLRLPAPDVPRYERGAADPAGAAQRLRFEWELGYAPVPNMVHLLEAHGVRVFSLPEHLGDVDAFSFWWDGTPFVLLNTRKSAERGRFDAAHELAHLVVHADYDLPRGREREWEANRFAAAFLMPEEDVLASGLRNAGHEQVIAAKHRWGVAAMALTHRLHELGLTTDWTYTTTCRRLSQLGYRSSEPDGGLRETSRLLDKAFAVLRQRGLRLPDVARELHLHPATLRELMFGLVLTPVQRT
jgi:Zn-dependent peptidase ImmA (M78 family)/DNA-binding XRE family transcriptional regulator